VLVLAAFCVVVGFGFVGCRSGTALTAQEAEGKHLYDVRCAHCHEENNLGLKKAPPNLHGIFKSASLPSGAPATDNEVQRVVIEGKGLMPAFAGRFSAEQMADLLAYLHKGIR
jgi:mono/diheme cytochrome c family protein